jgi:hypothetical protein
MLRSITNNLITTYLNGLWQVIIGLDEPTLLTNLYDSQNNL